MNLFSMSSADIDRAAEAHYENLYNRYFRDDLPEPCCGNCRDYYGGFCFFQSREEERETDDYCEYYRVKEDDYPDYMDGE